MAEQIQLIFYDEKYLEDLENIRLPDAQRKFTATPQEVIATLSDPNRHLILILRNTICAGYFILHENDGPAEVGFDVHTLLIQSLAINPAEQGKGLAFQGMRLLPEFVKDNFAGINQLVLVVNEKNIPAQRLYKKVGFIEHSSRYSELHGTQMIYYYGL